MGLLGFLSVSPDLGVAAGMGEISRKRGDYKVPDLAPVKVHGQDPQRAMCVRVRWRLVHAAGEWSYRDFPLEEHPAATELRDTFASLPGYEVRLDVIRRWEVTKGQRSSQ